MQIMHLFQQVRHTPVFAFLVGMGCALLGVATGWVLFAGGPLMGSIGIITVFFTSLALFPSWDKVASIKAITSGTESEVLRGGGVRMTELKMANIGGRFNPIHIIENHRSLFLAYIFSFLGIFIVYVLLQLLLPDAMAHELFVQQKGIFGAAGADLNATFWSLLTNNLGVLAICFLISLVYRSGIFIIAWNASVWGVVLATFLKQGPPTGEGMLMFVLITIIAIMPHLIIEALSYLSAAIAGAVTFKAFWRNFNTERFGVLVTDAFVVLGFAVLLVVLGAAVEAYYAFPMLQG